MKENICTNIIHITYYGLTHENLIASSEIKNILNKKTTLICEYLDEDDLLTDCQFNSKWTAPLSLLDELSEKYKVDILGVSYEFDDGYVESYEILTKLDEETSDGIFKTVNDENIHDGIDTIVLPENELDILNVLEDDINVSDKEIFEWKGKELEDWQKRVVEENSELNIKIESLSLFINLNPNHEDIINLKDQLSAMINYRNILKRRISKF